MTTPTVPDLAARLADVAVVHGDFELADGRRLTSYFDEYRLAANPHLLAEVAEAMVTMVPADTDVLAGIELGGIPLAVALSKATGIPAAFVRQLPKKYGSHRQLEGTEPEGRQVVLVDDVVRSGTRLLTTTRVLRIAGARVTDALCVLERPLGGRTMLAEHRVTLHALLAEADLPSPKVGERA
jgi:orotate phosphoribosyltransferase